jgi:ABC-type polysaccharide/polyol phosphate export permease
MTVKTAGRARQILASRELMWNLSLRELRTKYRRSFLGWSWSLLNPIATVVIYSFVFGRVFRAEAPQASNADIKNFALFMLVGVLPWGFFGLVSNLGMTALSGNASLVRKVAFPRETLVFSQALFAFVQHSIEMSLLCMVMLAAGSPVFVHLPLIFVYMCVSALFATGVGLFLSVVNVYFRDLQYLWTVFLQMWFFATPIVYPKELLDGRVPTWMIRVLDMNPMGIVVEGLRDMLYHGEWPSFGRLAILVVMAVGMLAIGMFTFGKLSRRLAEEL